MCRSLMRLDRATVRWRRRSRQKPVSGRWNHGDGTIWSVAMFASKLLSPINCCQTRALVGHLADVHATRRLYMAIQENSSWAPIAMSGQRSPRRAITHNPAYQSSRFGSIGWVHAFGSSMRLSSSFAICHSIPSCPTSPGMSRPATSRNRRRSLLRDSPPTSSGVDCHDFAEGHRRSSCISFLPALC